MGIWHGRFHAYHIKFIFFNGNFIIKYLFEGYSCSAGQKFFTFLEHQDSLACIQIPATGPYSKPSERSPQLHASVSQDLF
jgi:hypothetical protein